MTDTQALELLAARVEAATGPDRHIDCVIFATVHPDKFGGGAALYQRLNWTRNRADWIWLRDLGMPAYTASLDAATSLFPAETMYRSGHSALSPDPSMFFCDAVLPNGEAVHSLAATEENARVAAALRARIQIAKGAENG